MEFYAISEAEEREQAMRWGVAERPLSPGRTLGYLTVFQIMMAVQCIPGREVQQVVMIAGAFAILMAAMWVTYLIYRSMKRTAFEVETIAFFLCTLSFAVAAAYDPSNLLTQTICVIAGIVVFLVLSVLLRDLKSTVSLRWPVAIFTCLLLIFNVLFGSQLFGARNWIHIGPIGFQPSEFVKIAFIFTGAATLDRLFARRNLIFTILFCGFCMGCLALMSDFGTALIFFVALLVIAFMFKSACESLGMDQFIIEKVAPLMGGQLLPFVIFLVATVMTFALANAWGVSAIMVPLVVPLVQAMDANMAVAIAAIFSGSVFGTQLCFYSDNSILIGQATNILPLDHVRTQMPFALCAGVLAAAAYLIYGFAFL